MDRRIFKEEHIIFRDAFKKYAAKEITPNLEKWDEEGIVPREAFKKMGENGFLCPWMEEKYGGMGASFEYSLVIVEEMAYIGCNSLMPSLHSDITVPYIYNYGSEEQKMKWLPGCASGDIMTAIAMTEPNTGSDIAAIKTTAVRDGGDYIINGQKTFISNGIQNDLAVVAVKTDPKAGFKGISLIVVENGTPGYNKGRKLHKMGLRGQDTAELSFEDCRVPAANLLGEEGKGFYYLMAKLQQERLFTCTSAQVMAEAMLEMTIKYCKERTVFGKPVSSYQANTFRIVDMATEIELGRAFLDSLLEDHIAGKEIVKKVSMAKAWICEMANRVAYDCVQLHGGYGYMDEYAISRFARDIRIFPIFAGTTEVMKVIVGRMMDL